MPVPPRALGACAARRRLRPVARSPLPVVGVSVLRAAVAPGATKSERAGPLCCPEEGQDAGLPQACPSRWRALETAQYALYYWPVR